MAVKNLAPGQRPLHLILISSEYFFRERKTKENYRITFNESAPRGKGIAIKIYKQISDKWIELHRSKVGFGNDCDYPSSLIRKLVQDSGKEAVK